MQAGLDSGVYRRGIQYPAEPDHGRPEPLWVSQGWEDVIELLRERGASCLRYASFSCAAVAGSTAPSWVRMRACAAEDEPSPVARTVMSDPVAVQSRFRFRSRFQSRDRGCCALRCTDCGRRGIFRVGHR